MHSGAGKVSVILAYLLKRNGVIILRRSICLIEIIHLKQFGETLDSCDDHAVLCLLLALSFSFLTVAKRERTACCAAAQCQRAAAHLCHFHSHDLVFFLGHFQDLTLKHAYLLKQILITDK